MPGERVRVRGNSQITSTFTIKKFHMKRREDIWLSSMLVDATLYCLPTALPSLMGHTTGTVRSSTIQQYWTDPILNIHADSSVRFPSESDAYLRFDSLPLKAHVIDSELAQAWWKLSR